jgi:hypothetical protein
MLGHLPRETRGMGIEAMLARLTSRFPELSIGNFTLPRARSNSQAP